MATTKLQISTSIQILKPVDIVFENIIDPVKMSNYFIGQGSARMTEGVRLIWHFPEFEGDVAIRVGEVVVNKLVSYYWFIDENEYLVEINLVSSSDGNTIVYVTEKEAENDEKGIAWLKGNTEGWANFLASLKAYCEYGINLRKGAFDYRFTCTDENKEK